MKELHITRARLQPWQATQTVKALDEQLARCGIGIGEGDNTI